MTAFDLLKKASNTSTKSKTKAKTIDAPHLEEVTKELRTLITELKDLDAEKKKTEMDLINEVRKFHRSSILEGDPEKTYRVNDKILCIFTDKFSKILPEDVKMLESTLSKEAFDKLFKPTATIKVKTNVASNETKLKEMLDAIGAENIEKYFDIGVETFPVKDFDKTVSTLGCYEEVEKIINSSRSKPTIKVV